MQYTLPENLKTEIDGLERMIVEYTTGKISAAELKAHRVPFGVYEQRRDGSYMIRIRCAAGIITPAQLRAAAALAQAHGTGRLHVTTRQEIQIHDVALDSIIPVIAGLFDAGLSTRGGGGNTVRNITASWDSGIAPGETFDVTPHAVALTSRLIALPGSWLLPRKFKIAFSNSDADTACATVNDLGFVATSRGSARGFRVFVAGGLGRMPRPAILLHEFVPEYEVFPVAEAVKRVFSLFGNRRNKHLARLRFLHTALDHEEFTRRYSEQRSALSADSCAPFIVPEISESFHEPADLDPVRVSGEEFDLWTKRYVQAQAQHGLRSVIVPLHLGDISASQAEGLARVLANFGDDTIRFTQDQNIAIRNIPEAHLGTIFRTAQEVSSLWSKPRFFGQSTACAGATTCRLGICRSRDLLTAIIGRLDGLGINIDNLQNIRMHISGCANSCGRHSVSDIGFYGKAGSKDHAVYPVYSVVAGAAVNGLRGTVLAQKIDEIPARDIPGLVGGLFSAYLSCRHAYRSFQDFLEKEGIALIREFCRNHREIPGIEQDPAYYRDWGSHERFSLAGRGTGECAAGIFDLIDIALEKARASRWSLDTERDPEKRGELFHALARFSVRALCATRGEESRSDYELLEFFERNFIDTGIIAEKFRPAVHAASEGSHSCAQLPELITAFSAAVEACYASMDDSFQFHPTTATLSSNESAKVLPRIDCTKDLRGVSCPMNFVKTKLTLSQMKTGEILQVLLDDGEPSQNVPRSVESEGHLIVNLSRLGDHWSVLIQKAV